MLNSQRTLAFRLSCLTWNIVDADWRESGCCIPKGRSLLRLLGSLRFEVMTRPGILVDDHWRNANPCSGAHGVSVPNSFR